MIGKQPVPLAIIGGNLGAGKTTLLNHILHYGEDRRIVVNVTDFGSINIDADLIECQEGDTWSYTSESPLDGDTFYKMVASLPEGVLRAKGILYLQENPEKRYIFQLVGKRWSIEAAENWSDEHPRSKLVLIGLPGSFDSDSLEEKLSSGNRK